MTRHWYCRRCSVLSLPPARAHSARMSSLMSSAERRAAPDRAGSGIVDIR
ncbi:hypothetical protein ACFVW2_15645 [Streptomyces sp. NPDC058171]